MLEQLELELADPEEDAAEAEAAAQMAAERAKPRRSMCVRSSGGARPGGRSPSTCRASASYVQRRPIACAATAIGRARSAKTSRRRWSSCHGQWTVIQHVREKFSCRACEAINQPPAPFHPISRGRAGPRLLVHILFAEYGLHLPLNRQSTAYAHEGVALDVSTPFLFVVKIVVTTLAEE
ncbi:MULTISPECIES: IS66 family transposase [unclassified Bradyrhizobium]|uniref:IS66 family transposase n=1 Tax=unclassified Bradyrhizobium TaxID=2631580 RepID=UPI0028E9857F|nr:MULTISPECIES: transposase [unclassified Bradyrhizobium]